MTTWERIQAGFWCPFKDAHNTLWVHGFVSVTPVNLPGGSAKDLYAWTGDHSAFSPTLDQFVFARRLFYVMEHKHGKLCKIFSARPDHVKTAIQKINQIKVVEKL